MTRHRLKAGYVDVSLDSTFGNAHEIQVGATTLVTGAELEPKTKLRGLNQFSRLEKDVVLQVVRSVEDFAPSPHQWLSQWHMQLGWEMLQFDWQEER